MTVQDQQGVYSSKRRVLAAIRHQAADRLPLMYRALPSVNRRMLELFGLDPDIGRSWKELLRRLPADAFSGGASLGKFTKYAPRYAGGNPITADSNLLYAWGIDADYAEDGRMIGFRTNRRFAALDSLDELRAFPYPSLDELCFTGMEPDSRLREDYFLCAGCLNCLFMISQYLRGFDKLLVELLSEKRLAHYYVDRIGELALSVTEQLLSRLGGRIDLYVMWDDLADQRGLLISRDLFQEYYLPWYKKILMAANRYGLISFFHICGNAREIIPDLIDIGVDILDPIQTSARGMDLPGLKRQYGRHICFHGGIDVQTMLPQGKPVDIAAYVRGMAELFASEGGLILGPSHEIIADIPLENILAVYQA